MDRARFDAYSYYGSEEVLSPGLLGMSCSSSILKVFLKRTGSFCLFRYAGKLNRFIKLVIKNVY